MEYTKIMIWVGVIVMGLTIYSLLTDRNRPDRECDYSCQIENQRMIDAQYEAESKQMQLYR